MAKVNSNRSSKRRGFTVIELAISLAVIAIVTVATVSIINSQQRIYTKTSQTIEATNITENAIECFRYAVNNHEGSTVEESFETAFAETGVNLVGENGNYTVHKNGLTVVIEIEGNTITAVSTDSWGKEILNESYTK